MGAAASIESVQNLDAEHLAKLAEDNKCPPIVKKTIEENFINGATLGELNDEVIGTLVSSPIQKAQLLGAFHGLSPRATGNDADNHTRGAHSGSAHQKETLDDSDGLDAELEKHDVSLNDLFNHRYAIICACDNYGPAHGSDLPKLNCAVNDANLYEKTLKAMGMEVTVLTNEQCNKATIDDVLDKTVTRFGHGKTAAQFIFIYAGHGVEDPAGRGWIAPYGFKGDKLHQTGFRMDKLKDFAEEIGASQQLWIFDCCHAGNVLLGGHRGASSGRFALSKAKRPSVQAMTAVTKDQKAIEMEGNGVFSKVFCAGLTAFEEERKFVTFNKLTTYIDERVDMKSDGKMAPQFGKMLLDHYGKPCEGQFVFFNANDPPIAKMSKPAAAKTTGDTRGAKEDQAKAQRDATRAVKATIDTAEEKNDCSIVVTALKDTEEADVAAYALKSLMFLAFKNDENKVKIAAVGGIETVLDAMKRHPQHEGVQKQGCWALDNICWTSHTRLLEYNGGVDLIKLARQNHPGNSDLMKDSEHLLANLKKANKYDDMVVLV